MTDPAPLRVALLNDFPLVVQGLRRMLQPFADRVVVVDVASEGAVDAEIDIALYDTFGVGSRDVHWSERLGGHAVPRHVVLYSWRRTAPQPAPTSAGTVTVQVPKTLDGASLVDVLEQIHATGSYELRAVGPADPDVPDLHQRRWPGQKEGLTERESEILALIVTGISNKELAARLFIGVNTVKTYIRSGYRTMGVSDRPNAILWAIDHGFRR